jgi:hypothetical protein
MSTLGQKVDVCCYSNIVAVVLAAYSTDHLNKIHGPVLFPKSQALFIRS